ncbi:hypothetical protein BC938DRAFT_481349 [Jimgerdemannia flammicorona]|uniref:Uncharacterized protein n=1 Tax=Jimgerdemannia flammicorona TaxID=994334 RepID=A0A433QGA6_9FUNG|nr:hypothetical protein BC938DRAFT_481349 [Jimgerdemannia flammicorona]
MRGWRWSYPRRCNTLDPVGLSNHTTRLSNLIKDLELALSTVRLQELRKEEVSLQEVRLQTHFTFSGSSHRATSHHNPSPNSGDQPSPSRHLSQVVHDHTVAEDAEKQDIEMEEEDEDEGEADLFEESPSELLSPLGASEFQFFGCDKLSEKMDQSAILSSSNKLPDSDTPTTEPEKTHERAADERPASLSVKIYDLEAETIVALESDPPDGGLPRVLRARGLPDLVLIGDCHGGDARQRDHVPLRCAGGDDVGSAWAARDHDDRVHGGGGGPGRGIVCDEPVAVVLEVGCGLAQTSCVAKGFFMGSDQQWSTSQPSVSPVSHFSQHTQTPSTSSPYSFSNPLPSPAQWFQKKRGLAMGIVISVWIRLDHANPGVDDVRTTGRGVSDGEDEVEGTEETDVRFRSV